MSILFRLAVLVPVAAHAATFQTVYTFPSGIGPAGPDVGMVLVSGSALYGLISSTQALPYGAIFRFDLASGTVTTPYVFSGRGDGSVPHQTLLPDANGNLYGTTQFGGNFACAQGGCGTVFRFSTVSRQMTTLHAFTVFSQDGAYPATGALVFGLGGNLYGTTEYGGPGGRGTIYSISPGGGPLTTLYSSADGPVGALALDASFTLYGATAAGGIAGAGTLFKLAPPAQGQTAWTYSTLYSFTGTFDGGYPLSGLVAGRGGAYFGTTESGGDKHGDGTFFRIVPATGRFSVLHKFGTLEGGSGIVPLITDANFDLYGVTPNGGPGKCGGGCGAVYEMNRNAWKWTLLYDFTNGKDGRRPQSPLVFDGTGALYGTAMGGHLEGGTIFKVTP